MRLLKITSLTILTLVAVSTVADTLDQDSTHTTPVFTLDSQEWLDKVGIVDVDRQTAPFEADSCVVGDHRLPIPFVQDELAGRPLAFFSMRDVFLDLGYKRQEESPKDIQVVFDTLSRLVVYIRCTGEVRRPEYLYPWPERNHEELQLKHGGEMYTSIPVTKPSINVIAALESCEFYPNASQDLKMYYVMYSERQSTPVPAWVVDMRGLGLWGVTRRAHYSNTYRHQVVNADSGRPLMITNTPYPILEPDSLDPLLW